MKSVFRLLFVLALISLETCSKLIAATLVDPSLSGAVTWTQEKSPYLVRHDTRLLPGASLVIYPGVVIEVDTIPDESVRGGSSNVDFIIQGQLQVLGNDFAPVSMVSARPPLNWGVLYVLPPVPLEFSSFHVSNGQLVLSQGGLKLNSCRISRGKGIGLGAGAMLQMTDCQLDENTAGLTFLDPSASATMTRTRLRQNEVGLNYRAGGTLSSTDSSVYDSGKYHAANLTAESITLPSLWWGTPNGNEIMKKMMDGRSQPGHGSFRFSLQLTADPMMKSVKGYDPGKDPGRYRRGESKFTIGPLFQAVLPRLNIPSAEFESLSLGYGVHGGFVLSRGFEMRGTFQNTEFSTSNPEKKSRLHISFMRLGLKARKLFPLGKLKRSFLFGEAGGLIGLTSRDMTRPQDPLDTTAPLINKKSEETNPHLTIGVGTAFSIGARHNTEIGLQYELVPLNGDNQGGSLIIIQGALNLYF